MCVSFTFLQISLFGKIAHYIFVMFKHVVDEIIHLFLYMVVLLHSHYDAASKNCGVESSAVFTKGLCQVLGLTFEKSQLKSEIWLRPFVNTAPGVHQM